MRMKTDSAAMSTARGAGRAYKYGMANAKPLAAATTVGGLSGYAAAKREPRPMAKSDNQYAYLAARVEKSYVNVPSSAGKTMQMLSGRYSALHAMSESADPKVAAKGRLLKRRMQAGMARRAKRGWSDPRANLSKALTDAGLKAFYSGSRSGGKAVSGGRYFKVKGNAPIITDAKREVLRSGDGKQTLVGRRKNAGKARAGLGDWDAQLRRVAASGDPVAAPRAAGQLRRWKAGAARSEAVRTGQAAPRVARKPRDFNL